MSDNIPFVDTDNPAEQAKNSVRGLLPWLPDPYTCPECAVHCDATQAYDSRTGAFHNQGYRPAWECPECGTEYIREGV